MKIRNGAKADGKKKSLSRKGEFHKRPPRRNN